MNPFSPSAKKHVTQKREALSLDRNTSLVPAKQERKHKKMQPDMCHGHGENVAAASHGGASRQRSCGRPTKMLHLSLCELEGK